MDIDFNTYQNGALLTAIYPDAGKNPIYPILELSGETAEVARIVLDGVKPDYRTNYLCLVLKMIIKTGQIAQQIKKAMRDDDLQISDDRKNAITGACFGLTKVVSQLASELETGRDQIDPIWQKMSCETNGICDELGDCLYPIASLATEYGVKLEACAKLNATKLNDRWQRDVIAGDGDNR